MITATCSNETCQWHNVERNVLGNPPRVECGACQNNCELTDQRDDPPTEEEPTP